MNCSEAISSLATALSAAHAEIENASKNSKNPHFQSKYADLAEIINTVRPVFSRHGLSVTQCPSYTQGIVTVTTVLMHNSGEWISSDCSAPVSKQDAQGVGSAITYCRRYALAAMACIAQEDDDANGAVGHGNSQKQQSTPPKKPSAPATPSKSVSLDALYEMVAEIAKSTGSDDNAVISRITKGTCKVVTDIEAITEQSRVRLFDLLTSEIKGA